MKTTTSLLLAFLFQISLSAQEINSSYYFSGTRSSFEKGNLSFAFRNNNFLKNNEYFNEFTEGITYFGSIFQPEISYDLSAKARFSAGWYLRYFYGQEKFNASLPVFRLEYEPAKGINLIFGQLYGLQEHALVEPVYSSDNFFSRNPEYGIQLKTHHRRLKSDTWISWDHFILPGDHEQEEISAGTNLSVFLLGSPDDQLTLHFQSVVHHLGGQVDASASPLQTRLNLAPGLEYATPCRKNANLHYTLGTYLIQSADRSGTATLPYKNGFAAYAFTMAEYKGIRGLLSYFHGEYYFAPLGDPLFFSYSSLNNWYMKDSRNLLNAKLMYGKELAEGIHLGFRFETYIDTDLPHLDFSYGLNIRTDARWLLHKFKAPAETGTSR